MRGILHLRRLYRKSSGAYRLPDWELIVRLRTRLMVEPEIRYDTRY